MGPGEGDKKHPNFSGFVKNQTAGKRRSRKSASKTKAPKRKGSRRGKKSSKK